MSAVDRVIDALNAHDLEAFLSCYAAGATIEDGHDRVLAKGHQGMRERYGTMLAEYPEARWTALMRVDIGPFVVQHEEVVGRGESSRHVCIYLVEDGVIARERVVA